MSKNFGIIWLWISKFNFISSTVMIVTTLVFFYIRRILLAGKNIIYLIFIFLNESKLNK